MSEVKSNPAEKAKTGQDAAFLDPLRYQSFAVLWVATVVSNIGTWMQSAAAGWFMTSLDSRPSMVALVQVAASMPMFIFAIPAGAIGDIVDRRQLIVVVQVVLTILIIGFVLMTRFPPVSFQRCQTRSPERSDNLQN